MSHTSIQLPTEEISSQFFPSYADSVEQNKVKSFTPVKISIFFSKESVDRVHKEHVKSLMSISRLLTSNQNVSSEAFTFNNVIDSSDSPSHLGIKRKAEPILWYDSPFKKRCTPLPDSAAIQLVEKKVWFYSELINIIRLKSYQEFKNLFPYSKRTETDVNIMIYAFSQFFTICNKESYAKKIAICERKAVNSYMKKTRLISEGIVPSVRHNFIFKADLLKFLEYDQNKTNLILNGTSRKICNITWAINFLSNFDEERKQELIDIISVDN